MKVPALPPAQARERVRALRARGCEVATRRVRDGILVFKKCPPRVSFGEYNPYRGGKRQRWHAVEDDRGIVRFAGSYTNSLRYYKQRGGMRAGMHLLSMTKDQEGSSQPVVGKRWG